MDFDDNDVPGRRPRPGTVGIATLDRSAITWCPFRTT